MSLFGIRVDKRILLLAGTVVLAVSVIIGVVVREPSKPVEASPVDVSDLQTAVQRLLTRHKIDLKSVRTRKVRSGEQTISRIEQRIVIPPGFSTLRFNHDLGREVAPFGAAVIATEKSEDRTVTMHIKKDGTIVQSIVLVEKRENK